MVNNFIELMRQYTEFKKRMEGQNPNKILEEMLKSGKVTQAEVDNARSIAQMFQSILK